MLLDVEGPRVDPFEKALLWDDLFPEFSDEVCNNQEEAWQSGRSLNEKIHKVAPIKTDLGKLRVSGA